MDTDLLRAFRAGDHRALARIYEQYAHELRRTLARRGRLADEDLADVLQDVFAHTFSVQVRKSYDGRREFRPFLHAIARNVLCDWARRRKRESSPICEIVDANAQLIDHPVESPSLSMLAEIVEGFVNDMPPELREVYVERYLEARTQAQAAAALGISRQTLRTRERRLVDSLRTILEVTEFAGGKQKSPTNDCAKIVSELSKAQ